MTDSGSGAARYFAAVAGMEEFGLTIKGLIKELLRANGIVVHTIDHRVKTEKSATRKLAAPDSTYEGYSSLHDLLGLRITCYFADQVDQVAELIEREFHVDPKKSVDKGKELGIKEFGYLSVHRVARMGRQRAELAEYRRFKSLRFEVQIRSVLQHDWAEIEHDLGYKQDSIPEPMSRRFSMLAGVLELVDFEFMALRDELAKYEKDADDAALSQLTDMALDIATLTAVLKLDPIISGLDKEIASAGQRRLRTGRPDPKYLLRRVAQLREMNVHSISQLRQAVDEWRPYIVAFTPGWLGRTHYSKEGQSELVPVDRTRDHAFPPGVGLYYLWLAMKLQAKTQGEVTAPFLKDDSVALRIWADTVDRIGEAPLLPKAL